jgi:dTDP-4-dehydrorhamnose reductase
MTTALVVGADGTIGHALAAALEARGDEVVRTTRRTGAATDSKSLHFDLADPDSVAALPPADVTVICAAMARYADCREQPELAALINVETPARIAGLQTGRGGHVILLSTSAVFDCLTPHMRADAPTNPTSAYGRFKAEAEGRVLAFAPNASVLRLTKVLTPDMPLIRGWIERLKNGERVEAFADLTISPLTVGHVVEALLAVIDDRAGGIYQASGAGDISYADVARYLADRLGADAALVVKTSAASAGIPDNEIARFTSLETERLSRLSEFAPPREREIFGSLFF